MAILDASKGEKPMSVFRRGNVYWFEFNFNGARIRESASTSSKTIAKQAEAQRRRELELGFNGLTRPERPLFPLAAKGWFATKSSLSPLGIRYYEQYIAKLSSHFGNRLVSDITAEDVAELQRKRKAADLSGRQINAEIGTLRAILRYYGRWAHISGRVTMLPQRSDVGRALSRQEEERLLEAIGQSRSPALYPFFVLSLDAGLRPSETRSLRRSNLRLDWRDGAVSEGEIIVGRSKTEAGAGRMVPLTRRACAALTLWLSRFPNGASEDFVFPFHRVAINGNARTPHLYDVRRDAPMGPSSYKTAFETAREKAGLTLRFYDARHTFVTRLAENPGISEETIRQLAGHVSPRMLAHYAHIRVQARRAAIASLEAMAESALSSDGDSAGVSASSYQGARTLN
jgi:integrase